MTRTLEADPKIEIVASASNGEQAISVMKRHDIEVVVLDIEMPVMDGLTALPKLLAVDRHVKVIMASTLTQKNAKVSFQALAAGAADYIPKPSATRDIHSGDGFKRELTEKVKALGAAYRSRRDEGRAAAPASGYAARSASSPKALMRGKTADAGASDAQAINLRKASPGKVDIIAIGSSTGGPEALLALMTELNGNVDVPVMITQHMPPTFTTILAAHIGRASGKKCAEAVDGEPVLRGRIFLAPGDYHMTVALENGEKVIRLAIVFTGPVLPSSTITAGEP
ncbi:MAG: response regulator [Proteobacteria bacterium]|nr:response regulator [Pseudomonadota bacterium]